jgi:uncharacterized protein YdaU (DUF1376 family)
MTKIWKMGISPDNFISDTQDLTNEELGVYFRLICFAWKKEAYLPKDHERLQRIGQNCDLKIIKHLLEQFFIEDEKGFYCKAQKEEFDWVVEKSEKAKISAEKRWEKTQSERNANNSYSYIFNNIWSKLDVKRGNKKQAEKAYKRIHGSIEPELLIEKYNNKAKSVSDTQYLQHFSTWLNNEGWTEELNIKKEKDNFGIQIRDKFANLGLWKKGIKTLNDFDDDIIKKYKEGEITKEAMEKMNISI